MDFYQEIRRKEDLPLLGELPLFLIFQYKIREDTIFIKTEQSKAKNQKYNP